jgi:hypothetical protein
MRSWYPIVHGRTAFVDFRSNLIVVPKILSDPELEWAKRHILATTRAPDRLPGNPRWSVFQTPELVVVGVTCMAAEVSHEMTNEIVVVDGRDVERRPLYVFLGYASRRHESGLPPRDLHLFGDLYRFVKARWREPWHDSREKHISSDREELPMVPAGSLVRLNDRDDLLSVWPRSRADELWASAANFHGASLCIGLPNAAEALEGVFHNATLQHGEDEFSVRREPHPPRPGRRSAGRPEGAPDPHREPSPGQREGAYDSTRAPLVHPPSLRDGGCPLRGIFDELSAALGSLWELITGGGEPGGYAPRAGDTEDRDGGHAREHGRERDRPPAPPTRQGPAGNPPRSTASAGFVPSPKGAPKPRGSTRDWWDQESDPPGSAGAGRGPSAPDPPRPDRPAPAPPDSASAEKTADGGAGRTSEEGGASRAGE